MGIRLGIGILSWMRVVVTTTSRPVVIAPCFEQRSSSKFDGADACAVCTASYGEARLSSLSFARQLSPCQICDDSY